ncbi:MAG: hypothetical protein WBZ37_06235 [Mycobacterium sp.]
MDLIGKAKRAGKLIGRNLMALLALAVSIVSAAFAYLAHEDAKDSLANQSPVITLVPTAGTFDSSGRIFTPIPHKTRLLASIADISGDKDWLELQFENGGGRAIRIDQIGIREENGNDKFFTPAEIAPLSAPCASNKAVGMCGTAAFTVKQQDNVVVFYPLFAAADWLQGGYEDHDEDLKVVYKSTDIRDDGKTPDALVKVTP